MYTVALIVDALVVVDTPESTLVNTEVKKTLINGVCISMGLQLYMEIVLFYMINPLPQHSKKPAAISCNNECTWAKESFGAGG